MLFDQLSTVQWISISILPLLFAIILHEIAHGWVAMKLGDNTAKMMGRLTLNPISHIDPIGTIAVPLGLLLMSSLFGGMMIFGWAKPVPINWRNLRKPRRDIALVSVAGPAANLLMAIFWLIILKMTPEPTLVGDLNTAAFFWMMAVLGVLFNLLLMVLNLLPLLPLDGGRILNSLLPYNLARQYAASEPYGFFILLALLALDLLHYLLAPAMWLFRLFIGFA